MKLGKHSRQMNYIGLFVLFFLQNIDNYVREKQMYIAGFNAFKNIVLLFIGVIFLIEIYWLKELGSSSFNTVFSSELKSIMLLAASFFVLSLYYIFKNQEYVMETFVGIIKIVIPIIVAYSVINVMEIKDIYKLMSVLLILTFVGFLFSKMNVMSISNFKKINFWTSSSPFESNFFSPLAMAFCLFFCFYRENKFLTYLSVFFTIMTFKRVMILYAVLLLLLGGSVRKWKKVPKSLLIIFSFMFILISLYYVRLMRGEVSDIVQQFIGMDVNTFVMGRAYFMRVIFRNFTSLGYMSSTVGYKSMEMDIPMIYTEMGILSVIVLVLCMMNLVKNNWYNFLIIIFVLLELLTSHWLDITYFWIVVYITIGCITYKTDKSVCDLQKKKVKFKIVLKRRM